MRLRDDRAFFDFSHDGELFSHLSRVFGDDISSRDFIATWHLYNRATGQRINLPIPTWDWGYDSSSVHINKEKNSILFHDIDDGYRESMIVDISTQQIIHEEHQAEGTKADKQHIYSRDLSKIIYFEPTARGSCVCVKDLKGNLLHSWNFDFPLEHAHHAQDDHHLLLFSEKEYFQNDKRINSVTKVMANIQSGALSAYSQEEDDDAFVHNLGYQSDDCFSADGKYQTTDQKTKKARVWQLPPTLDAKKHSLAEIMAYRVLENNRIAQDKPSDAAKNVLLKSLHTELRSFAKSLDYKKYAHRRSSSL